jgi:hypothetical protein
MFARLTESTHQAQTRQLPFSLLRLPLPETTADRQGGSFACVAQGLTAWAVVYNRFAVNPTSVDFSSSGLAGEFRIPRDAQPVRELRS